MFEYLFKQVEIVSGIISEYTRNNPKAEKLNLVMEVVENDIKKNKICLYLNLININN